MRVAIGDWPKHARFRVVRHCPWFYFSRWRVTVTVFQGSGHWLVALGPLWFSSYMVGRA